MSSGPRRSNRGPACAPRQLFFSRNARALSPHMSGGGGRKHERRKKAKNKRQDFAFGDSRRTKRARARSTEEGDFQHTHRNRGAVRLSGRPRDGAAVAEDAVATRAVDGSGRERGVGGVNELAPSIESARPDKAKRKSRDSWETPGLVLRRTPGAGGNAARHSCEPPLEPPPEPPRRSNATPPFCFF